MKVLVDVSDGVLKTPCDARVPDHALDAVQSVALVEDHSIVVDSPALIVVGVALIESDGAGGGGALATETFAVACTLVLFAPEQVSTKLELAKRAALVSTPLAPLLPDQAPDATHCVVFALDHEIVMLPPYATAEALVEMLTVGGGGCVVVKEEVDSG